MNIVRDIYLAEKKTMRLIISPIGSGFKRFIVSNNRQIKDIKMEIKFQTGLFTDDQALYYQGEILDDEKILSEYEISDNSIIKMITRLRGGMLILAKTMDGKTLVFEVQKTETIRNLKFKIQEKTGIVPDDQKLVYQGGTLEDEKTIEDYRINEKCVINVVARPRSYMIIYAKTMNGQDAIAVENTDKISDIKKKIREKVGLAPEDQRLVYQGIILENDKTVGEYQIVDQSVIDVDILKKAMTIVVRKWDDKSVIIPVHDTDQIGSLKSIIEEKFGLAPDRQTLVYQDKVLKDNETFRDHSISHLDMIIVVTTVGGGLQILTSPMGGGYATTGAQIFYIISVVSRNFQCQILPIPDQQEFVYLRDQSFENCGRDVKKILK